MLVASQSEDTHLLKGSSCGAGSSDVVLVEVVLLQVVPVNVFVL